MCLPSRSTSGGQSEGSVGSEEGTEAPIEASVVEEAADEEEEEEED